MAIIRLKVLSNAELDLFYIGTNSYTSTKLKAGLLRYKELQLPKMCRGTEIVRMNSNNPGSPLETNYR